MKNCIGDKKYLEYLRNRIMQTCNKDIDTDSQDCWIWPLAKDKDGYGYCTVNRASRRNQKAHVVSWVAFNECLPEKPLVLRHTCNNVACCNPLHLVLGTATENNRDRFKDNEKYSKNNKLTQITVFDLYSLRDQGYTAKQLAEHFKISEEAARNAYLGKSWKSCYKSYYGEEKE